MATAVTRAFEHVHARISDGRLRPGERLFEGEIADACGVSRTPVREALRRLSGDGLVEMHGKRGAYVATWSPEDLEVVFDLRTLLEPYGAARAATRITGVVLDRLADLDERMHAAADREAWSEIAPLNNAFHLAVLEAADNDRLLAPARRLIHVPLVHRPEGQDAAATRQALNHHTHVIEALRKGDPGAASAVMENHLLHSRRALLRVLALDGRPSTLDAMFAVRA